MPILNYTTEVPTDRTIGEIQKMLGKAGAEQSSVRYVRGEPSALTFELEHREYLLPCRVDAIAHLLATEKGIRAKQRTREHAQRVAWRIVRDWVQAQLAIIEVEMVKPDEVFMPYQLSGTEGKTLYQVYRSAAAPGSPGSLAAIAEDRPERLLGKA